MTTGGKAYKSKRRRGTPRARPYMTSATATSSSGAAETPPLKTRIGHDWTTLLRRLRRWRKSARMARCKLNAVPPAVRTVAIAAVALGLFSVANFVYHVVRKPTEMFFPVSATLNKMPAETWRQYAPLFNEYSTATITPELLAALAQVESAGNPVARTYWRWRLTWHPFEIYQPASSAVGMYQLTDAAFADARHYCIRHHIVVEEGAWNDWHSCWFNRSVFPRRAEPCHRAYGGVLGPECHGDTRTPVKRGSKFAADAGSRCHRPSLRCRSGRSLRPQWFSTDAARTLRRPRRRVLSRPRSTR